MHADDDGGGFHQLDRDDRTMIASLAMYPFPWVRASYDRMWDNVRRHLDDAPTSLDWTTDLNEVWSSPNLYVAQSCGWPLVSQLADKVAVIGTFDLSLQFDEHDHTAAEGSYRSIIIGRDAARAYHPSAVAAMNGPESLSGWISLCWTLGRTPKHIDTGSHLASVIAVANGAADVASIDALSFAYLRTARPDLIREVKVLGRGPSVPCLPLITTSANKPLVGRLRAAFTAAVNQPAAATLNRTMHIRSFVPRDMSDYSSLKELNS